MEVKGDTVAEVFEVGVVLPVDEELLKDVILITTDEGLVDAELLCTDELLF